MTTFQLRSGPHVFVLARGDFVIGRSTRSQLVLDDPLVSRRHAVIHVDEDRTSIEDAGSRNAVLVNGTLLRDPRALGAGDVIRIGDHELIVLESETSDDETSDDAGRIKRIASCVAHPPLASEPVTDTVPSLLLSDLAGEALRDGNAADAKWILGRILAGLHYRLSGGEPIERETMDAAAIQVLRLVEITNETSWMDGLFDLLAAAGRVLPNALIDRLEPLLAAGASRVRLGHYVGALRSRLTTMSTVERLLVDRLDELLLRAAG